MDSTNRVTRNGVTAFLECMKCKETTHIQQMVSACLQCNGPLQYVFVGEYQGQTLDRTDLWKNFDLIPLVDQANIVSLNVGDSAIIELEELSDILRGAKLFIKLDSQKNPTGTFKDREASIIMSRCKELGLDHLVFYSTGNAGRAYTHYAAHLGLTTYFFMPRECQYKNTASITKNKNNFIILIDAHYPEIGPYVKKFAVENNLHAIAPLHDRIECYATVAYEQFQQMPNCDFFVQTIASGLGAIGFVRGHNNLIKFGLEQEADRPRVICVQSRETNSMYRAYTSGKTKMSSDDLPSEFPPNLFEPTLNSTNSVNNYPDLYKCLQDSNGIITDTDPKDVIKDSDRLIEALEKRNIVLQLDLEKSVFIGFSGLVKLAEEGAIGKNDRLLLLVTGRGNDRARSLIPPDIAINPAIDDPKDVKQRLDKSSHGTIL